MGLWTWLTYLYLAHAYTHEKEKLLQSYNDIEDNININVKILLFSKATIDEEKEMILKSINSSFDDIADNFITKEVFSKMLELNISREQLFEFMYHSNEKVRSVGLEYLLENSDIQINSRELDYVLNTNFFETTSKNGREIKEYRGGVVREYIKSLEKYGYAEEKKVNEEFSIFAKFSERFPQP